MAKVVLGLDIGSSAVKTIAHDESGTTVGEGRVESPITHGPHGTDYPVLDLLAAARASVRQASIGHTVAGIGMASMGEIGTLVAPDGTFASLDFPAWYDERGSDTIAELWNRLGGAANEANGGHLRTISTLAKLSWLRRSGAELSGTFLGLCGLLARDWTGESWQETSLATTSGAYDPLGGAWLPDIWAAAGLADIALPPVLGPGVGLVATGAAARDDGMDSALVVIAGHDHPVAAVGTGGEPGSVVDSMGTGEALLAAWTGEPPTREHAAQLIRDGLTIETWPSTGNPILISEGIRPGLAIATLLAGGGIGRDEFENSAPGGIRRPFTREECAALEDSDPSPLQARGLPGSGREAWLAAGHDLLEAYARDCAAGERRLREATYASGPLILTGGGTRSSAWLAAKARHAIAETRVSPVRDGGTRGAAAIVGASLGWWPSAAQMP